jgi:hypothetical protein
MYRVDNVEPIKLSKTMYGYTPTTSGCVYKIAQGSIRKEGYV